MQPIHVRQTLEITLLRGKDHRYRAFCAMRQADGYAMGCDLLNGKGLSDPWASWQRFLYKNTEFQKWWDLFPVLRPELDQRADESRADWARRLIATMHAAVVQLRDQAGQIVNAVSEPLIVETAAATHDREAQ